MIQLAPDAGRQLAVSQQYRHSPVVRKLRGLRLAWHRLHLMIRSLSAMHGPDTSCHRALWNHGGYSLDIITVIFTLQHCLK
jgi:predicted dehydrogenase